MNPKKWRLHLHVHRQLFAWQHNSTQEVLQWQKLHEDSIFLCWCWKHLRNVPKRSNKVHPKTINIPTWSASLINQIKPWFTMAAKRNIKISHDSRLIHAHVYVFQSVRRHQQLKLGTKKRHEIWRHTNNCNSATHSPVDLHKLQNYS